ncbi:LysE family translocator [Algivirga pacifica]|uniref:LysE family translocator n=1 Tax=Algivirga pacifica TaxID=1162670 RepID=A0ABP9D585_9BACT
MEQTLWAFILFACITSFTPGPNNYLLLYYGKTFGVRSGVKILAGILLGFWTLLLLAGYGMAELIAANETLGWIIKVIGSIWLLYLAWMMSGMSVKQEATPVKRLTFYQVYMMQFLNPKGWLMAVTAAGTLMPDWGNTHTNVLFFSSFFILLGVFSGSLWLSMGELIAKKMRSERVHKWMGYVLSGLMVLSVGMLWS